MFYVNTHIEDVIRTTEIKNEQLCGIMLLDQVNLNETPLWPLH